MIQILSSLILFLISISAYALQPAITHPIPISDLQNFTIYPKEVKTLINTAYTLTQQNLTYMYGSADPKNGGMDCSGTIYFLLNTAHLSNLPRSSKEMFLWVKEKGTLYEVTNQDFTSSDFSHLKPGDLLFWEGTYQVNHYPPISHVMLYLGKNSQNEPLMFGSSDGRTYEGKKMWGVSVFDFKLPKNGDSARFVGYSCIPSLTCRNN